MHKIKCPKCGRDDGLARNEQLQAHALIRPEEYSKEGWEYEGESKMQWDTQGRGGMEDYFEFYCRCCGANFDWDKEVGVTGIADTPPKTPLSCPKCKKSDKLQRIEMMYVYAKVVPSEESPCGYEHGETYEDMGETQQRYEWMDDEPEFHCQDCDLDFDWTPERGPYIKE